MICTVPKKSHICQPVQCLSGEAVDRAVAHGHSTKLLVDLTVTVFAIGFPYVLLFFTSLPSSPVPSPIERERKNRQICHGQSIYLEAKINMTIRPSGY